MYKLPTALISRQLPVYRCQCKMNFDSFKKIALQVMSYPANKMLSSCLVRFGDDGDLIVDKDYTVYPPGPGSDICEIESGFKGSSRHLIRVLRGYRDPMTYEFSTLDYDNVLMCNRARVLYDLLYRFDFDEIDAVHDCLRVAWSNETGTMGDLYMSIFDEEIFNEIVTTYKSGTEYRQRMARIKCDLREALLPIRMAASQMHLSVDLQTKAQIDRATNDYCREHGITRTENGTIVLNIAKKTRTSFTRRKRFKGYERRKQAAVSLLFTLKD